jgi:hypothetical protein
LQKQPARVKVRCFRQSKTIWSFTVLSDRSALTNLCLLATLVFLVLSSGVLQCAYNCMEADASRRAFLSHDRHAPRVADCHPTFPEPQQVASCPNRSCHQNQAAGRSLGGPVLSGASSTLGPVLGGSRLSVPDLRSGWPLQQKKRQPPLLASRQPPTTTSQTLRGVRMTVLLN